MTRFDKEKRNNDNKTMSRLLKEKWPDNWMKRGNKSNNQRKINKSAQWTKWCTHDVRSSSRTRHWKWKMARWLSLNVPARLIQALCRHASTISWKESQTGKRNYIARCRGMLCYINPWPQFLQHKPKQ